jgi:hypothetical protein
VSTAATRARPITLAATSWAGVTAVSRPLRSHATPHARDERRLGSTVTDRHRFAPCPRRTDRLPVGLAEASEPRAVPLPRRAARRAGQHRRAARSRLRLDRRPVVGTLGELHRAVSATRTRELKRTRPSGRAVDRSPPYAWGAARTACRPTPRHGLNSRKISCARRSHRGPIREGVPPEISVPAKVRAPCEKSAKMSCVAKA